MGELWRRQDLSYGRYVTGSALHRLGHIAWRERLVKNYLDLLYSQEGVAAIGFKFMLNHLRSFPSVVPYIRENKVRVIHVVRKNVFDTYLSRVTMKVRGFAHSTKDSVQQVRVRIPVDSLVGELENIEQANEQWAMYFQQDVPCLRISYEDFVTDRATQMDKVAGFLDVDQSIALQSNLKKLNTGRLSDIVENLEEVRRCLEGTVFEWCTDNRD